MTKRRQRGVIRSIDTFSYPKYGITVPIDLNKEKGQFIATYGRETFTAESLQKLKDELHAYINAHSELPWQPVIRIKVRGHASTITDVVNSKSHGGEYYQASFDDLEGVLHLESSRFWIAKRQDGVWVKCGEWHSRDYQSEGTTREQALNEEGRKSFCDGATDRRANTEEYYEAKNAGVDFALPFHHADRHSWERGQEEVWIVAYSESLWDALNAIGDKMKQLHQQLLALVGSDEVRLKLQSFAQRLLPGKAGQA